MSNHKRPLKPGPSLYYHGLPRRLRLLLGILQVVKLLSEMMLQAEVSLKHQSIKYYGLCDLPQFQ